MILSDLLWPFMPNPGCHKDLRRKFFTAVLSTLRMRNSIAPCSPKRWLPNSWPDDPEVVIAILLFPAIHLTVPTWTGPSAADKQKSVCQMLLYSGWPQSAGRASVRIVPDVLSIAGKNPVLRPRWPLSNPSGLQRVNLHVEAIALPACCLQRRQKTGSWNVPACPFRRVEVFMLLSCRKMRGWGEPMAGSATGRQPTDGWKGSVGGFRQPTTDLTPRKLDPVQGAWYLEVRNHL